ncbi:MAG TPA: flagellar basal body protein [Burkholderiaceae bacterium]|nr:flagellar basal body protein [Burkholderiaceae bacterium]
MSNTAEAVTSTLMKLALDGASLRHQAIAANIANAGSPGYAPVRVDFEQRLRQARERIESGEAPNSVAADASATIENEPRGAAVSPGSIDLQTAQLAQNVVHYQALARGWSKRMAILSTAINEGKR